MVFAPKYRRKIIYKQLRQDIIEIFKKLWKEMKVESIEGEACPDPYPPAGKYSTIYECSTVYGNTQECIRKQLEEDLASDQISLKEYMDPFTGEK